MNMMDKNLEQIASAIQLVSSGREWLKTDKDQSACDRCLEIAIKRLEGFYADNHAMISAAPELLEACKAALQSMESFKSWPEVSESIKLAQEAINKAEGK
jgi:hypothetical protein